MSRSLTTSNESVLDVGDMGHCRLPRLGPLA
jgi:hypothetical protein